MARGNFPLYAFNGGQVSPLALARADFQKLAICGQTVRNWQVNLLGPMSLRPGTHYLTRTRNNLATRLVPFVGTTATCSLLELTDQKLRILNEGVLVARTAVTTTITNGNFTTLAGWTTVVAAGGSVTASGSGTAYIAGAGVSRSKLRQAVTVPGGSAGAEHGLTITVGYGPVNFRIGTTAGDDDVVAESIMNTGTHRLAIVLTGTVYLEFSAPNLYRREVGPVSLDGAGTLEVAAPWLAADLDNVRVCQEGDVIFVACRGYAQRRIVSRGRKSWSIEEYRSVKGPFMPPKDDSISITPSAQTGATTLTASSQLFKAGHVGSIVELMHTGQDVIATVSGADQWTSAIRVTGVDTKGTDSHNAHTGQRTFTVKISGTWVGTITLQRSFGTVDAMGDFTKYTANTVTEVNDTNDNAIVFWRIGFDAGDYTSGSAVVELNYAGGSTIGVVRITGFTSNTVVSGEVILQLGATTGTAHWRQGFWSAVQGYPRDVVVTDGRLWWLGSNYLFGSVSDAYDNYDDSTTGDSGPVIRSIATGPADGNLWFLRLANLVVGSATAINMVRSSALDEPITPTSFTARAVDQLGGANVAPAPVGPRGVYVGRSGIDLLEVSSSDNNSGYSVATLMRLAPEIASVGIARIFVQRRPDPRVYVILADGTMAIVTYNRDENVVAWTTYETEGLVEDGVCLPNTVEDDVYLVINRSFNAVMTRCIERQAYVKDTVGDTTTYLADCGHTGTAVGPGATSLINVSPDFNDRNVSVWANGRGYADLNVTDGQLTLPDGVTATSIWYGLQYTALFESTKLAYAGSGGTALMQVKRVDHLGFMLANTALAGLTFGPDLAHMDGFPSEDRTGPVDMGAVQHLSLDDIAPAFNGVLATDARFFLQARSPWPVTALGAVIGMSTYDAR